MNMSGIRDWDERHGSSGRRTRNDCVERDSFRSESKVVDGIWEWGVGPYVVLEDE